MVRRIAVALTVAGLTLTALIWKRNDSGAGSMHACLRGGSCENLAFRAGSKLVAPETMRSLLQIPSVKDGASRVREVRTVREEGKAMLFLIADTPQGREAFLVNVLPTASTSMYAGQLLFQLLKIAAVSRASALQTQGQVLEAVSQGFEPCADLLKESGIAQVEVLNDEAWAVEQVPENLRVMARAAGDQKRRIIRP